MKINLLLFIIIGLLVFQIGRQVGNNKVISSSKQLKLYAMSVCDHISEVDGSRFLCVYEIIINKCKTEYLDLSVCGELTKGQ